MLTHAAPNAGEIVRVRLSQWAMGRPPGEVLSIERHLADVLVARNAGTIEEGGPRAAPIRNKRIAGPPQAKGG